MLKRRPSPAQATAARLSRRNMLAASTTLGSLIALGLTPADESLAAPRLGGNPFTLGVASGDPLPESVVLWTRLALDPLNGGGMPNRPYAVRWVLASDEGMQRVVRTGVALALPELSHSVHVEINGLQPGREYFYGFRVGNEYSPIARTRTAPAANAHVDSMRFAVATCQKWEDGFFSPYYRMAEEDLDLVFHLGDYTYEYGISSSGPRNQDLPAIFQNETVTLEEYRRRHALYKLDPDLQRVHSLFPMSVIWDDHEVENDYTGLLSENYDPIEFFTARRTAAYQAFYEHLPLRAFSMPQGAEMLLYRRFAYGNLADFSLLDTRQYRSDHPCTDGEWPRCEGSADPAQTVLGDAQERWLLNNLSRSKARWNVIAQQILMAELDHKQGPGEVFWQDAWDGYPLARLRVLNHIHRNKIANPVVITGDWHSTFVNDLKLDFKNPNSPVVASEFVTPAINSGGDGTPYGPYYGPMIPENPHIKFFEGDRRGYIRVDLNQQRWLSDVRYVDTVSRRNSPISTFTSWVVEAGKPGVKPA